MHLSKSNPKISSFIKSNLNDEIINLALKRGYYALMEVFFGAGLLSENLDRGVLKNLLLKLPATLWVSLFDNIKGIMDRADPSTKLGIQIDLISVISECPNKLHWIASMPRSFSFEDIIELLTFDDLKDFLRDLGSDERAAFIKDFLIAFMRRTDLTPEEKLKILIKGINEFPFELAKDFLIKILPIILEGRDYYDPFFSTSNAYKQLGLIVDSIRKRPDLTFDQKNQFFKEAITTSTGDHVERILSSTRYFITIDSKTMKGENESQQVTILEWLRIILSRSDLADRAKAKILVKMPMFYEYEQLVKIIPAMKQFVLSYKEPADVMVTFIHNLGLKFDIRPEDSKILYQDIKGLYAEMIDEIASGLLNKISSENSTPEKVKLFGDVLDELLFGDE